MLVDLLEAAGMRMHGVVLQSPAMNYNSSCDISNSSTRPCTGFIPSYAASGAWFNRTTPSPPAAQIDPFMADMRTFATTRYDPAVRALLTASAQPDPALVREVSLFTGEARSDVPHLFDERRERLVQFIHLQLDREEAEVEGNLVHADF